MNYIRTLVSGKKKRFTDRKYNLDLSYITPRIIAMAYPGSGFEVVFRNNIESVYIVINYQVSKFLKERHHGNYLVINLSGKKYDYAKFDNKVMEYQWVDHHAPPLKLLYVICNEIHNFLKGIYLY
jgi:phosphatidylinositol-3,4,5-trisphosphate 3-phosphatase/dual-specificity protein phosphatase PTEN